VAVAVADNVIRKPPRIRLQRSTHLCFAYLTLYIVARPAALRLPVPAQRLSCPAQPCPALPCPADAYQLLVDNYAYA
jgi:hypothetical protein